MKTALKSICIVIAAAISTCGSVQAATPYEDRQCKDKEWIAKQSVNRTPDVSLLFGKDIRLATVADLDEWIDSVSRCRLGALSSLLQVLISKRNTLFQQQEEIRKARFHRQEVVRKQQEAARVAQFEKQQQQEKEQLEQRQQQEQECRLHCPDKLASMLEELRSLKLDDKGIERFDQLRREYSDLRGSFPPDVREALRSLDDEFATRFGEREASMRKGEDDLKNTKQIEGDLPVLYGMQLMALMGLVLIIPILARIYYRDTKPATSVPVAPRRIASDDFEIVRREASCD